MHGIQRKDIVDISDINWNDLINIQRKKKPEKKKPGSHYWDKRAASFVDHVGKTFYPENLIKIIEPQSGWTVLDMGCGGGTLALPLGAKVKEITAVDFSDKMLELLNTEIQKRDIGNIQTVKASWDDDWSEKGIGHYDVAVASRSLSVDNLEDAIAKLNNASTKRVYISTVVGDGPYDRGIYEAIGRDLVPAVDYIYMYNLLYQMGVHANISFIHEETRKTFDDIDAAKKYLKWMLHDITPDEEQRLESYLIKNMAKIDGKKVFDYHKAFKWAVIWWSKEK